MLCELGGSLIAMVRNNVLRSAGTQVRLHSPASFTSLPPLPPPPRQLMAHAPSSLSGISGPGSLRLGAADDGHGGTQLGHRRQMVCGSAQGKGGSGMGEVWGYPSPSGSLLSMYQIHIMSRFVVVLMTTLPLCRRWPVYSWHIN